ncbi:hypothetical protein CVE29_09875, partial [Pseudomonas syringae pv. actinidiae]|nr:hypothetical protein [Pseudomonas syringae pv. actinidiae]
MQFWTLCVTQRFGDFSWICLRLKPPFRPSAPTCAPQHGRILEVKASLKLATVNEAKRNCRRA